MILNLTKLFPKSCAAQGIQELHVNIFDIKTFKRTERHMAGFRREAVIEDAVIGEGFHHRFTQNDDGIQHLGKIQHAVNIINSYNNNKPFLTEDRNKELEEEVRNAGEYLRKCVIDFS